MVERYFYAELNDQDICVGVSDVPSKLEGDNIIEIPEYDIFLTGMKYNRENDEWLEIETEYIPTDEELITAEILLNQADILAKQNEQDEVLAEILLNQMEV